MTKSGGNQRLTKRKRTEAPGNDNHEANAADKGKGKEPQSSAAGDEIKKLADDFDDFIEWSTTLRDMQILGLICGNMKVLSRPESNLLSVQWANQAGLIVLSPISSRKVFAVLGGIVPGVVVNDGVEIRLAMDESQLSNLRQYLSGYEFRRMELSPAEYEYLAHTSAIGTRIPKIPNHDTRRYLLFAQTIPQGFTQSIAVLQQATMEVLNLRRVQAAIGNLNTAKVLLFKSLKQYPAPVPQMMLGPLPQGSVAQFPQNSGDSANATQRQPAAHSNLPFGHMQDGQGRQLQRPRQVATNPSFPSQIHSMPGPQIVPFQSIQRTAQNGHVPALLEQNLAGTNGVNFNNVQSRTNLRTQHPHVNVPTRTNTPSGYHQLDVAAVGDFQMGGQSMPGSTNSRPLSVAPAPIMLPQPPPVRRAVSSAPQSIRSFSNGSNYQNQTGSNTPAPPPTQNAVNFAPQSNRDISSGTNYQNQTPPAALGQIEMQAPNPLKWPSIQGENGTGYHASPRLVKFGNGVVRSQTHTPFPPSSTHTPIPSHTHTSLQYYTELPPPVHTEQTANDYQQDSGNAYGLLALDPQLFVQSSVQEPLVQPLEAEQTTIEAQQHDDNLHYQTVAEAEAAQYEQNNFYFADYVDNTAAGSSTGPDTTSLDFAWPGAADLAAAGSPTGPDTMLHNPQTTNSIADNAVVGSSTGPDTKSYHPAGNGIADNAVAGSSTGPGTMLYDEWMGDF
ncbi:hypothetical protein CVT25_001087 [Psilocybe cyanescens]|uniref:Uncharacterized protein n=1 Tax=Psilocybe cyanescens TaxID=93625 RepID=A0A409XB25_PSICY|nr:hypothetical protein CVT25_001087 [Psilocybe cyanescens]